MSPKYTHTLPLAGGIEPPAQGPHSPRRKQRGSLSVFRASKVTTMTTT